MHFGWLAVVVGWCCDVMMHFGWLAGVVGWLVVAGCWLVLW